MTFKLDDSLKALGIEKIVVAIVKGIDTTVALNEELEHELQIAEEKALKVSADSLAENRVIQGYIELIQKIKRSKKKYPPTVEALIKNSQRRQSFPRINSVVDLYNVEALNTYFSIGAHDLKKITFPIEFTVSKEETVFQPILSSEKKVMPFDYVYRDQKGVMAYLDCRDSEDYKLDETTTEALFVIQGNEATPVSDRMASLEHLVQQLKKVMPDLTYTIQVIS
ncbi:B3/B4 domain-containing protein [Vagococcus sp.]|uniref:B3/B4 domain-containing protein n=1 Tax=Vagococcus sp. TaxID=1933889 RepID=UPI003F993A29